ncbi:hypothetical protein KCP76_03175 [Salmonella enterica subsp. enterica serovar Weltevreden]|nr:hypothetical protein KCP76_03175 [Salmonella enterica subsp. enterica serovar Weltevreden]
MVTSLVGKSCGKGHHRHCQTRRSLTPRAAAKSFTDMVYNMLRHRIMFCMDSCIVRRVELTSVWQYSLIL